MPIPTIGELDAAIAHFEMLQKRYTTQHNGQQCKFVETALFTLNLSKELITNGSIFVVGD